MNGLYKSQGFTNKATKWGNETHTIDLDSGESIMPNALDPRVGPAVAKAVAEAAKRNGVARN